MRSFEREISLWWEYPKGILPYSRLHMIELCSHLSLPPYLVKVSEKSKVSYNQLFAEFNAYSFMWEKTDHESSSEEGFASIARSDRIVNARGRIITDDTEGSLRNLLPSWKQHQYQSFIRVLPTGIYFDAVSSCIIASPVDLHPQWSPNCSHISFPAFPCHSPTHSITSHFIPTFRHRSNAVPKGSESVRGQRGLR